MSFRRVAAAAVVSLALVAPATAAQATGTTPPVVYKNSCKTSVATLPASVEGAPASFKAGAPKGLYLWHTAKGWQVRVTHDLPKTAANKAVKIEVRGQITATRPITSVKLVRLERKQRGEWVAVKRPRRATLDFQFVNYGGIDGINFKAGCAGKLNVTVWQITRDAKTNKVVGKVALPVFVGSVPTTLTTSTTPALDAAALAAGVSKFTILRTPVAKP